MITNKISSVFKSSFKICDSVVTESGVTIPQIVGQVGEVDVVSQNGYRYKINFWDTILNQPIVQQQIQNRDMINCIEHPLDDDEFLKTSYPNASHVVMKAWVKNHNPYAILGLLNNQHGNAIKALIDVGCHPGVSTRGLGNFGYDDISQYVDDKDYILLGWDIVKNPNFASLKMDKVSDSLRTNPIFTELCEMHQLKDSADEHYSRERLLSDMKLAIESLTKVRDGLLKM